MTRRTLSLKREALAELTGAQLGSVVGAQATGACTAGCTAETELDCRLTIKGSRCIYV